MWIPFGLVRNVRGKDQPEASDPSHDLPTQGAISRDPSDLPAASGHHVNDADIWTDGVLFLQTSPLLVSVLSSETGRD